MYAYNLQDQTLIEERVAQFRDQVRRRLSGELSEERFRPLRLMNGLYHQRHAYMLRVAIPYGLLSSRQLRQLAYIARRYDKGYGHFTTRQNIQFNWPKLEETPDILADLAAVQMHAIQTSGNCIRNITADHLAGVAPDEIEDPRPYCEILRQWSTLHPEFSFLPRKFKIALTGAPTDRAAILYHDIGYRIVRNEAGAIGFRVYVGGGMGRTPVIGKLLRGLLAPEDLLAYTEAILRVYNRYGRRDNIYKARIKILVNELGIAEFRDKVEQEWREMGDSGLRLEPEAIAQMKTHFAPPRYRRDAAWEERSPAEAGRERSFAVWAEHNVQAHGEPGYAVVTVSLKHPDQAPGDVTAEQMERLAELADRFSFGRLRATHEQNLILSDVAKRDLYALWQALVGLKLATPNVGTLTDIICCPCLDYCNLANAGTISVAEAINRRFDDLDYLYDLGPLKIKMSGCMNSCAHHHVGDIGILGVDKKGEEHYQILLGGSATEKASLGRNLGPALPKAQIPQAIGDIIEVFVANRRDAEPFIDTYRRIGPQPFKERIYGQVDQKRAAG